MLHSALSAVRKHKGGAAMAHAIYTVQPADEAEGLLGIARHLYEDESRWMAIYDANRVVIGNNPTVVRAGQQLVLPDFYPRNAGALAPCVRGAAWRYCPRFARHRGTALGCPRALARFICDQQGRDWRRSAPTSTRTMADCAVKKKKRDEG